MATALERSHAPDATTRYEAVVELGGEPNAEAAARLVALLDDHAEVCVDEGSFFHDVDPTYRPVSLAAREGLRRMGAFTWPAVSAAWSALSADARRATLAALAAQPLESRARLSDEAHVLLEDEARRIGAPSAIAIATWERAFAARVRRGELSEPETFWRAAHDHPSPVERDRSFISLASVVNDPAALGYELLALLQRTDVWPQYLVTALTHLPPAMPAELVESIVGSEVVHKYPEIWEWLARHGDAARALLPVCVAALTHTTGGYPVWIPTMLDERRWRLATEAIVAFGPLPADVRATLLDRLATTSEMMSIEGSLRRWLCELLGDPTEVETELTPRLEEMERSADPVAVARARELRSRFAFMRRGS